MFFFLHLPKTAGTSLRNALSAAIGERLVPVYRFRPDWTQDAAVARRDSIPPDAIIFGHYPWGFHKRFDQPPRYATILRHPFDRVVSWYRWQATHSHLPFHDQIRAGLPLGDMIEAGLDRTLTNDMTAYISGGAPAGLSDVSAVEAAKANLQTFEFVSVVEALVLDLPNLSKAIGVPLPALPVENASDFNLPIDNETRAIVAKHNALDLQLFEFAARLAEARNPDIRGTWSKTGGAAVTA